MRHNRVRLVEGATQGYVELEGTPDMVLEIISPTSVRKDTEMLRDSTGEPGFANTGWWMLAAKSRFSIFCGTLSVAIR